MHNKNKLLINQLTFNIMNTKNLFKNLAILLVVTLGIFAIYSFTSSNAEVTDLTSYDTSYYQDNDVINSTTTFAAVIDSDGKCGDDKKAKEAKTDKDAKCGEGKCGDDKKAADAKTDKDAKCGEGKCGDDKAAKDSTATKDAKCGEGKCG